MTFHFISFYSSSHSMPVAVFNRHKSSGNQSEKLGLGLRLLHQAEQTFEVACINPDGVVDIQNRDLKNEFEALKIGYCITLVNDKTCLDEIREQLLTESKLTIICAHGLPASRCPKEDLAAVKTTSRQRWKRVKAAAELQK